MKISIITVCFNSEATIERTIKSVLAQKNIDLEYLIIDGASKDGTLGIIKNYAEKNPCIHFVSEKDNGIYDAMNKGISMATGDVVGILNSDDYYASTDSLSSIISVFEQNNVEMVFGNLLYVKNNKPYRYWKSGKPRTFKFGWMPPHPALFVKAEVYKNNGVFRLDCGINADYELMLRFFEKEKLSSLWLDKIITCMEAGGTSNNGIKSRVAGIKNDSLAWKVNGLKKHWYTVILKKLRKTPQFFVLDKKLPI
ncbi:glycosyltransferase family 2 protein [uncultured Treponema sp.]|uniref:glycosyltransferase family 2 protein n=1 Tax=uncultured Treponema sp. TaxID=162155 RepID=UPI0025F99504|nr:glycosyltransferase family 2 protein [uncultured Treponema sp.]